MFREIFGQDANWRTMTGRLSAVGLLDAPHEDLQRILSLGESV